MNLRNLSNITTYMPAAILDAILNISRVFEEAILELLLC